MTPRDEPCGVDWAHVAKLLDEYGKELAIAKTFLTKLDHSLFGNGQPGLIEKIEDRLDLLEKERDINYGVARQKEDSISNVLKIVGIVGGALGIWLHILGLGIHVK